ncbi:MAG: hypothetical protein C0433_04535 [Cyclobacterium sp.]|nr:hypothetical protein [Cyclobacterium sp.]
MVKPFNKPREIKVNNGGQQPRSGLNFLEMDLQIPKTKKVLMQSKPKNFFNFKIESPPGVGLSRIPNIEK